LVSVLTSVLASVLTSVLGSALPSLQCQHSTLSYLSRLGRLGLNLLNRLHLLGNLGADGAVANSRAVDLLNSKLLLAGVLELDKAEALRAAEGAAARKTTEAADNVGGLDLDGPLVEEVRKTLVVDVEGKVGDEDSVLRVRNGHITARLPQTHLAGLAGQGEAGLALLGLLGLLGLLLGLVTLGAVDAGVLGRLGLGSLLGLGLGLGVLGLDSGLVAVLGTTATTSLGL